MSAPASTEDRNQEAQRRLQARFDRLYPQICERYIASRASDFEKEAAAEWIRQIGTIDVVADPELLNPDLTFTSDPLRDRRPVIVMRSDVAMKENEDDALDMTVSDGIARILFGCGFLGKVANEGTGFIPEELRKAYEQRHLRLADGTVNWLAFGPVDRSTMLEERRPAKLQERNLERCDAFILSDNTIPGAGRRDAAQLKMGDFYKDGSHLGFWQRLRRGIERSLQRLEDDIPVLGKLLRPFNRAQTGKRIDAMWQRIGEHKRDDRVAVQSETAPAAEQEATREPEVAVEREPAHAPADRVSDRPPPSRAGRGTLGI